MWWIGNLKEHKFQVPQYFILQLVFQCIFHEGGSKEISCHWGRVREGFQRTFRRSILLFLSGDITAVFRQFFFFFPSVWSPECPLTTVPWAWHPITVLTVRCRGWPAVSSGFPTAEVISTTVPEGSSWRWKQPSSKFLLCSRLKTRSSVHVQQDRKGGKGGLVPEKPWQCVGWQFFKICRRGPVGSTRFLLPWSVEM